jgi:hypothetical protein
LNEESELTDGSYCGEDSFAAGTIQDYEERIRFNWGIKSLPWLILMDRRHIVTTENFGVDELDDKI